MAKRSTVFYAYPSNPLGIGEMVNAAIDELKSGQDKRQSNVRFKPWPEIRASGQPLAGQGVNSLVES